MTRSHERRRLPRDPTMHRTGTSTRSSGSRGRSSSGSGFRGRGSRRTRSSSGRGFALEFRVDFRAIFRTILITLQFLRSSGIHQIVRIGIARGLGKSVRGRVR